MNTISTQLGFWASLLSALACVTFTVCFVVIVLVNPRFTWSNLADYLAYREVANPIYAHIAQASMLAFALGYLLILNSFYDYTPDDKKVLIRTAIAFGIGFATLIGINYFVQITSVRFNLARGTTEGIEHFLQSKPDSPIASVNMLGWTVFFAVSSLCVAPIFSGGALESALYWLFMINGLFCLAAGVGFLLDNILMIFVTINLGMGGCITVIPILLAIFFHRHM